MQAVLSDIFLFFKSLGVLGAFLSMVIENIGVPLPTEIGYLIGQGLVNKGVYSYWLMVVILTFGHLFGSVISYLIGRFGHKYVKRKIHTWKKIVEVQAKLEKWYEKYGNLTVFLARFVGYVRPWSSFVAGFANVPIGQFLIWTALGSFIFNIITLYFSGIVILLWQRFPELRTVMISVGLFLFFGFLIYELIRSMRSKRLKK